MGSFVWSSDSKKIAYVAEMKKTGKEKTFFSGDKAKEDSIDETNFEQVRESCLVARLKKHKKFTFIL